ncbi:hypothetical protein HY932_01550 [Candidatus Falkowbacteria bacterium]|nr:hypothetical protein [Candidatus Falkowbacteria bacterium]
MCEGVKRSVGEAVYGKLFEREVQPTFKQRQRDRRLQARVAAAQAAAS